MQTTESTLTEKELILRILRGGRGRQKKKNKNIKRLTESQREDGYRGSGFRDDTQTTSYFARQATVAAVNQELARPPPSTMMGVGSQNIPLTALKARCLSPAPFPRIPSLPSSKSKPQVGASDWWNRGHMPAPGLQGSLKRKPNSWPSLWRSGI